MNCLLERLRGRCPFKEICEKEERLKFLKEWLDALKEKKRLLLNAIYDKKNLVLLAERQDYDIGHVEKKQHHIWTTSSDGIVFYSKEVPGICPYKGNCQQKSELLSLRIRAMNRQCFTLLNSYNQLCHLINSCIGFHKRFGIKAHEVFLALDAYNEDKLMYCSYPTGGSYDMQQLSIHLFRRELEGQIGHTSLWLKSLSASEDVIQSLGKKGMIIELKPEKKVTLEEVIFLLEKIEQLIERLVYLKRMQEVSFMYISLLAVKAEKRQLKMQLKNDLQLKLVGQIQSNGSYMEEQLLVRIRE